MPGVIGLKLLIYLLDYSSWGYCAPPLLAVFPAKRNGGFMRSIQRLDIGFLDHFRPFGYLGLDIGTKFLGTTAAVGHSEFREARFSVFAGKRLQRGGVELRNDIARHAGRTGNAKPGFRGEAWNPRFCDGRDVGRRGR